MSEIGEIWRAIKKERQEKRADNREQSAEILREAGIVFSTNNFGAHLIVEGPSGYIDFWPGTGKWHVRGASGTKGFGVRNLIKYING